MLPHVAVGLGLAARVRVLPRLDVAAGSTWSPAARLADGAFSVGLSAGRLGTCVVPVKAPSFELLGCADVLVGATHASALDASVTPAGDRSWIAVSGSALVALRVSGPLLVEVGVDGVVPLVRDTFVSARVLPGDKARNAFQQPAIAGILHFGAGVSF